MSKSGIKIIEETIGSGETVGRSDRVKIQYDMQLSGGEFLIQDAWETLTIDDRNTIAGLRYGIDGMREGGTRKFKASPHLCYRDLELARIPKNAVLVCTIKAISVVK